MLQKSVAEKTKQKHILQKREGIEKKSPIPSRCFSEEK